MEQYVFTYGTLMKNRSAYNKFAKLEYVCDATLNDYGIYDAPYYPCAVKIEGFKIIGEIYKVNNEQLNFLDRYEDEGDLYIRKEVLVIGADNKEYKVWFYEYNHDTSNLILRCPKNEKWNLAKDPISNYAWYVCYGSNLLRERFDYYLKKTKGVVYAEKKIIFDGELYFAKKSVKWENGGVAFVDLDNKRKKIYGYAYLLDLDQIDKISFEEGRWYPKQFIKIDEYGIDMYTVNGNYSGEINKPCLAYAEIIAAGLKQRYNLSDKEIINYLKIETVKKLDLSENHIKDILIKHC